jgi:hypothetical protein
MSRYDDPEYCKQVALQMLATPSHLIACRCITDQRIEINNNRVYINDLLERIKTLEEIVKETRRPA